MATKFNADEIIEIVNLYNSNETSYVVTSFMIGFQLRQRHPKFKFDNCRLRKYLNEMEKAGLLKSDKVKQNNIVWRVKRKAP